jgi:hypothetical protein
VVYSGVNAGISFPVPNDAFSGTAPIKSALGVAVPLVVPAPEPPTSKVEPLPPSALAFQDTPST